MKVSITPRSYTPQVCVLQKFDRTNNTVIKVSNMTNNLSFGQGSNPVKLLKNKAMAFLTAASLLLTGCANKSYQSISSKDLSKLFERYVDTSNNALFVKVKPDVKIKYEGTFFGNIKPQNSKFPADKEQVFYRAYFHSLTEQVGDEKFLKVMITEDRRRNVNFPENHITVQYGNNKFFRTIDFDDLEIFQ